ncbi:hypothetical protein [Hyphococcus sp.]|uniref:hypothetical protein n=1 Tax=Hyphococcus sp. TaxID=2038636 RepID=UPI003CCBA989
MPGRNIDIAALVDAIKKRNQQASIQTVVKKGKSPALSLAAIIGASRVSAAAKELEEGAYDPLANLQIVDDLGGLDEACLSAEKYAAYNSHDHNGAAESGRHGGAYGPHYLHDPYASRFDSPYARDHASHHDRRATTHDTHAGTHQNHRPNGSHDSHSTHAPHSDHQNHGGGTGQQMHNSVHGHGEKMTSENHGHHGDTGATEFAGHAGHGVAHAGHDGAQTGHSHHQAAHAGHQGVESHAGDAGNETASDEHEEVHVEAAQADHDHSKESDADDIEMLTPSDGEYGHSSHYQPHGVTLADLYTPPIDDLAAISGPLI